MKLGHVSIQGNTNTRRMFLNLANPECLVPHPNVERKQAD